MNVNIRQTKNSQIVINLKIINETNNLYSLPVNFQHLKQDQSELVILPAVNDDVDATVQNLQEVGGAGQYCSPEQSVSASLKCYNKL